MSEERHLLLKMSKHDIPASVDIVLKFDGDWSNIFDDEDDTEEDARNAMAEDIFRVILDEVK